MVSKEVLVNNATGLHARPASELVKLTQKFDSEFEITHEDKVINPKSILSILGAGVKSGTLVTVSADGVDEVEALDAVCDFIINLKE